MERYRSVWDAIEDTPGEAVNMRLRSALLAKIASQAKAWRVGREEAARRLGVTLPRLDELMGGRINRFSLDDLVSLSVSAGLRLELEIEDAKEVAAGV